MHEVARTKEPVIERQHVIVTGGSSGIGAAIAGLYAGRGAHVSIIARNREALAGAELTLKARAADARQRFCARSADVGDQSSLDSAVAASESELGPCDILVVSAGIVDADAFETLGKARFDGQIETNLIGAANAVRAVYGGMRQRRRGAILLIGSAAGLTGLYGYTAYCASKFGLLGFAEALRQEARPAGISVSICMPPDTDTPQLAGERRPAEAQAVTGTGPIWSAERVALKAIAGLDRGTFAIYPDLRTDLLGRFGGLAAPLLRRWIDWKITGVKRSVAAGSGSREGPGAPAPRP